MRLRAQLPFLVILLALCAPGCADFDRGPAAEGDGGGGGSTPPPTGSASFETDVHPLLVRRCSACHGAGSSRAYKLSGDPTTDYPVVLEFVNTGDPASSLLLLKGTGTTSHGGGAVLNDTDAATVESWIADGAPP